MGYFAGGEGLFEKQNSSRQTRLPRTNLHVTCPLPTFPPEFAQQNERLRCGLVILCYGSWLILNYISLPYFGPIFANLTSKLLLRLIPTGNDGLEKRKNKLNNLLLMKHLILCFALLISSFPLSAQVTEKTPVTDTLNRTANSIQIDYSNPRECVISGLTVSGVNYLNSDQILSLTGLAIGDTISIPGEELTSIVKRLFLQRFFSDVGVYVDSLVGNNAYLNINIVERPRVPAGITRE
jgi:hypothetical protein